MFVVPLALIVAELRDSSRFCISARRAGRIYDARFQGNYIGVLFRNVR